MAQFNYRVKAPTGSVSEGVIDAPDLRAAMEKLRRQKYLIVDINEAKPKSLFGGLSFGKGIKSAELSLFSRQLSTLVSSGVPICRKWASWTALIVFASAWRTRSRGVAGSLS